LAIAYTISLRKENTLSESTTQGGFVAGAPFIKFDGATAYIEAQRCEACGAVFMKPHVGCPRCCARGPLTKVRGSERGVLQTFTVVMRSFPGIKVPFVSAIVQMDDGATLKGNLIDVEPNPEKIRVGMPLRLVYGDANGLKDEAGSPYLAYFFQPAV